MAEATFTNAVSIKIPPFWTENPRLWFAQIEGQFTAMRITQQETKFGHIIGALAPPVAAEIEDVILEPPAENQYDALKNALITRLGVTEEERMDRLLTGVSLGDQKPSSLLRQMQRLRGTGAAALNDIVFRRLFLTRLPDHVQVALATRANVPLTELATQADVMMAVGNRVNCNTLEADTSTQKPSLSSLSSETLLEIDSLRRENARLRNQVEQQNVPRHTSDNQLCWFHAKFGTKARKCRSPCSWSGKAKAAH